MFFIGQAKLAVYFSIKYKINNGINTDCVQLFNSILRATLVLELYCYFKTNELDVFQNLCDYQHIITLKFKSLAYECAYLNVDMDHY